jgi:hypothetical protein
VPPTSATTAVPLPASIDAIDADFLTAALAERYRGVEVVDVGVGDTHSGTSSTVRLTLRYARNDAGLPERMLLKGSFARHEFAMGDLSAVEAQFYRDVAPILDGAQPAGRLLRRSRRSRRRSPSPWASDSPARQPTSRPSLPCGDVWSVHGGQRRCDTIAGRGQ